MENQTNKPFIFIGRGIENYFDSAFQPTDDIDLKFLIIKSPGSEITQMLLMQEGNPYTYHAQSLLKYMDENSISEVIVNGGGKIRFGLGAPKRVVFYNKSYAFGLPCLDELKEISEKYWLDFPVRIDINSNDRGNINISGKIYSYAKVKYEAENP